MKELTTKTVIKSEGKKTFEKIMFLSVCRFCKNPELIVCEVDVQGWNPEDYPNAVYCGGCGIRGPWGKTEEEAVDKWNELFRTKKEDYSGWEEVSIDYDGDLPF